MNKLLTLISYVLAVLFTGYAAYLLGMSDEKILKEGVALIWGAASYAAVLHFNDKWWK